MKLMVLLGGGALVVAGIVAMAAEPAKAGACNSPFQTSWFSAARCPQPNDGFGFGRGATALPPSASAQVEANIQVSVPGGLTDTAQAFGFNNNNKVVGTPQCSQGSGAPGCILCSVVDFDTGAASSEFSPQVCSQATKHLVNIHF
jgi:hypothetical protein